MKYPDQSSKGVVPIIADNNHSSVVKDETTTGDNDGDNDDDTIDKCGFRNNNNDTELCASNDAWPMKNIEAPHEHDVIYGRGGGTYHHVGNKKFRTMVEERKNKYNNSIRFQKADIALEIIRIWRNQNPPGRFLKQNEKTGFWDDVGDKEAGRKTSQALREKNIRQRNIRKRKQREEKQNMTRNTLHYIGNYEMNRPYNVKRRKELNDREEQNAILNLLKKEFAQYSDKNNENDVVAFLRKKIQDSEETTDLIRLKSEQQLEKPKPLPSLSSQQTSERSTALNCIIKNDLLGKPLAVGENRDRLRQHEDCNDGDNDYDSDDDDSIIETESKRITSELLQIVTPVVSDTNDNDDTRGNNIADDDRNHDFTSQKMVSTTSTTIPQPSVTLTEANRYETTVVDESGNLAGEVIGGGHHKYKELFPWKLHRILDDAASQNFEDVISWVSTYNGFKVHNPKFFAAEIAPKYDLPKYKSFQRQLNMWGFERVNGQDDDGPDRGSYVHDCFVRGRPDLCHRMQRIKIKGNNNNNNKNDMKQRSRKASAIIPSSSSSLASFNLIAAQKSVAELESLKEEIENKLDAARQMILLNQQT